MSLVTKINQLFFASSLALSLLVGRQAVSRDVETFFISKSKYDGTRLIGSSIFTVNDDGSNLTQIIEDGGGGRSFSRR